MTSPSNTIIIAGLTKPDFAGEDGSFVSHIRRLLDEKHIPIVHWAPLKSFGRVIVVLRSAKDAFNAKLVISTTSSHNDWSPDIKVFWTRHTPLSLFDKNANGDSYLKLPDAGKLWLISPPPSPPAGWSSRQESEPNKETTFHPEDLSEALLNNTNKSLKRSFTAPVDAPGSPQQKLTRRFTLHESTDIEVPSLALDTTNIPRSPESISTPTIVLEWEEEDFDDEEIEEPASFISTQPMFENDNMRQVRTELPPV